MTRAVRATNTAAGPVAEGDWLGIVRGDGIVAVAPSDGGGQTLLEHLVDDGRELVTVITGAEADAAVTADPVAWIGQRDPAVEVEVHDGGQPLYPYLVGVE